MLELETLLYYNTEQRKDISRTGDFEASIHEIYADLGLRYKVPN